MGPSKFHGYMHICGANQLEHIKQDELLWAASWLYVATRRSTYKNYITQEAVSVSVDEFSWDLKYAGAQMLLTTVKHTFFPSLSLIQIHIIYVYRCISCMRNV